MVVVLGNGHDGFAQFLPAGVGEQQDGFIAMIHLTVGKAGLVVEDEVNVIAAGNVECGDNGELGPVDARIEVDAANEAAGDGAAYGGPVPHAFALKVVHITGAAEQLVDAFFAEDGRADNGGLGDAGFGNRANLGKTKSRTG